MKNVYLISFNIQFNKASVYGDDNTLPGQTWLLQVLDSWEGPVQ